MAKYKNAEILATVISHWMSTNFSINYVIDILSIDGENVAIPDDNSYTFSNIDTNHTIHVDFAVGIKESDIEGAITLYPNPATHYVELKIENDHLNVKNIEIYDAYGKLLQILPILSTTTTIDFSIYAPGVYFVRLNTETGYLTRKVLKK